MYASFWNERYVSKEYVYGKEPNTFFKDFIHQKLRIPGKLLLPAEGEGRNAVFAATGRSRRSDDCHGQSGLQTGKACEPS